MVKFIFLFRVLTTRLLSVIPSENCGENEIYDPCSEISFLQDYESIGKTSNCQLGTSQKTPIICQGSCVCKPGFIRNKINECISEDDASKCRGPHEYFSCGGACDNICATLQEMNQTNCPIINIKCNPMCYCESGFARDSNKTCVPIEQCEKKCGLNEFYNRCCEMSSTQIGKGKNLKLKNGTKTPQNCQGCCECKPGFTRNKVNECVSEEDASKCRGPHEYFSCGGACDNVCATLQEMNQTNCPIINIKCNQMCYCESGYARNSNKTCVPIEQCETKELQLSGDENESLKHGLALFSMKLLYELVKDSIEMNYVISPMALFFPLSLLALYTTGSSNAQLLTALHAQNNEEIRKGVSGFSKQLKQDDKLFLAARVFVDFNFELNKMFIEDSKNVINTLPQNVDFRKPTLAADTINAFVASRTNGTITNMINPDTINEMTKLILINTLYFKANWTSQFNERNTKKRDFYITNDKTIQIDFMNKRGIMRYGDCPGINSKALEIAYNGENFKFNLFLPNDNGRTALINLITKLDQDTDLMYKCIDSLKSTLLDLYLPKFKIESTINLVHLLPKLNISSIFDQKNSGITGISKNYQDLWVTDALQKCFIIVSEKGSEAGAANAFQIGIRSLPSPPIEYTVFDVNRPFVFFITLNDTILFSGIKVQ